MKGQRRSGFVGLFVSLFLLVSLAVPTSAAAQSAGAIAGLVRDATGAVLPGVTVEASSPALIEKTRVVVTDERGQYRVVDLRPGVYAVTFSLTGFGTVKREGIELQAGFTAPVNVELSPSNIQETVTVAAASPVVDVQNVTQQHVLSREVIDAVPTGKVVFNLAALVPGMSLTGNGGAANDVGGLAGMGSIRMSIHGSAFSDSQLYVDGYTTRVLSTDASTLVHIPADANVEEYTIETGGRSAENETSGVRINIVPKDGGNRFSGSFNATFANEPMQSDNLSGALKQRGLKDANRGKETSQFSPAIGGPLRKDRVWFFGSIHRVIAETYAAGVYYDMNPLDWFYDPDLSKQEVTDQHQVGGNGRVTWQATRRNRFNAHYEQYELCHCHFGTGISAIIAPEAALKGTFPTLILQGTWTSTLTNRVLFRAGMSAYRVDSWNFTHQDESSGRPITELAGDFAGILYSSVPGMSGRLMDLRNYQASLAYVTGTHSIKVGADVLMGHVEATAWGSDLTNTYPATAANPLPITYTLLNRQPRSVTYLATPTRQINDPYRPNMAFYAQDQWTLSRLTVNGGLRFDWLKSSYPDQSVPPRPFIPASFSFPGAQVFNWKDLEPRLGVAYNVFGNGKTAIKGSLGRYALQLGATLGESINPVTSVGASQTRTWTDSNGDFIVQGDPLNLNANGELARSGNQNFGQPTGLTQLDPDFANGFGVRPYNWELSGGIQHELFANASVSASYFHRWFGNFQRDHNRAVSPADYDQYCITGPVDSRLPNGGGERICGLYDIKPAKLGLRNSEVTSSTKFGRQERYWNGMDLTSNVRLPRGIIVQGGVSVGKTVMDSCEVDAQIGYGRIGNAYNDFASLLPSDLGNPSQRFCRIEEPWLASVKVLTSYRLPWDMQVAATFQNDPAPPLLAAWTATNAQIAPTLGRNLATGANGTATIQLVAPGTLYEDRRNQLDLRVGKRFRGRGLTSQTNLDIYNALNASSVLSQNTTYGTDGTSWRVPRSILPGRLFKVGLLLNF